MPTTPPPEITAEIRAELERQEPLIRELSSALSDLVKDVEGPVIASAMLDMLFTLGAADELARAVLPTRLRKLAGMLEMMPPGVPTHEELQAFTRKANALVGNTPPAGSVSLILPDHIQRAH